MFRSIGALKHHHLPRWFLLLVSGSRSSRRTFYPAAACGNENVGSAGLRELGCANPNGDKDGKVTTVRYEAVNAMLLNEFLKEHRKVEEQQTTIAQMKKQIDLLTAGLQKVSDQMELAKAASQTIATNQ
jgi:hypothetical protein